MWGWPSMSSQPRSLNPAVSTTSVSPSQWPTRVAHPGWIGVLGKRAAVGENGAVNAVGGALIEDHRQGWGLNEPGQIDHMVIGKRVGEAIGARGIFAHGEDALLIEGFGPGLDIGRLEVAGDVAIVAAGAGAAPYTGEVGLAIGGARRGGGEIRFAVGGARGSGRGVV